ITLEKIEEISKTGVNLISVGAITHSARSVDISLEVMKK
ncbi:MAG: nicotinate-nucleotide diphosphorylase (carboxylating), partial [Deltaproteobacteria bacterium]